MSTIDDKEALRVLLDVLRSEIAYYDAQELCVFATKWYAEGFGLSANQLTGKHTREIVGEDAWRTVEPYVRRVLAGERVVYERLVHRDRLPPRWVEVTLAPRFDAHGQVIGNVVRQIDITARKRAEALASASEERVQRFFEVTLEGLVFFREEIIEDCNERFAQLLGRSREALIGTSVLDFFPAADREFAERHIHLGRDTPYPAKLVRRDGREVSVEIRGKLLDSTAGARRTVASVRDQSDMMQVTESLVRSQARYRALVEHADQIVIFVKDQRIAYANPFAARHFGLDPGGLSGVQSLNLMHPDDRALILSKRDVLYAGGAVDSYAARTISPPSEALQPSTRVSWVRVFPSMMEWEGYPAAMVFMTDVTAEREREEQVRKALERERELGELKTRFVSMASHEFRTPLATIQTSSELLQHYAERLSEDQRTEAIADIQSAVSRMQAMIENFLAFGRIGVDALGCTPRPTALGPTLAQIANDVMSADGHQRVVETDLAFDARTELMLDGVLMHQIVGNLLSNACKYSAFGASVWVKARRDGDNLVIDVRDQGIGVPSADLPRLFDTFHRASNAANIKGTGLGLAIVRRALDAHGGSIDVESAEGAGSTFSVTLPWVDAPSSP
jgi:PAS domain S-box-containing protein